MKNLTITAVLGLALLFPFSSYAAVNVFGVNTQVKKSEFSNNVKGGHIPAHFGDTFRVQKPAEKLSVVSNTAGRQNLVFGVDLNSIR